LLLKDGKVMARGTPEQMITSQNMTTLLGCQCRVDFIPPRWQLLIEE